MKFSYNIDRKSLVRLSLVAVSIIVLLILILAGSANIYKRVAKLSDASRYSSGRSDLDLKQVSLMNRYRDLQKMATGLSQDADVSSYNSRVAGVIEKISEFDLELKEVEYNKETSNGDLSFLPVDLELTGSFDRLMTFLDFIENQTQVIGIGRLELSAAGASETRLLIKVALNLYRLRS
jgi:Tfp pilus assembly protein PilO